MDETEYNKGLGMAILPDDYNYIFEDVKVISEMDEHGEIKMEISARVDVKNSNDLTTFIEEFYATSGSSLEGRTGKGRTQKSTGTENASCKLRKRREPTQRGKDCIKTVQLT